jgi:hypothetical protein
MFVETAKVHHATKAKAEKLAAMLEAEYPVLSLVPTYNEDQSQVTGFQTLYTEEIERTSTEDDGDTEEVSIVVLATKKVPELADILAACEDKDLDPEAIDAPEKPSGSVVDEIYRTQYREQSSTKQSCGDWLAEWLTCCLTEKKQLILEDYIAVLNNNGIDLTAKWARVLDNKTPGWQGRFRMNGRQQLEKAIALSGEMKGVTGEEVEVDAGWLEHMRSKHAKWIAKEQKAIAAADSLAAE